MTLNLFPLKLSSVLLWSPWETNRDLASLLGRPEVAPSGLFDPVGLVKQAIPKDLPIKITQVIPRLKESGAYVKFTYPPGISPAEIEAKLVKSLIENPIKPWFSPFRGIKASLVQGRPWLEDLYRLPKGRLKVEFIPTGDGEPPGELSQESLYNLFRRYGKIADIVSQPPDSKVVPRYAYVDFVLVRDAIMARNCMHGFVLKEEGSKNPTRLRLSYEQRVKPHHFWSWISGHPKIVIPIIAAVLAAFTVAVFDPIREFFVQSHIQKSLDLTNSNLYKWLKRQTSDILSFKPRKEETAGLSALFTHHRELIDTVQSSLLESGDTFVVVHGPRGSGARELIMNQVLHDRRDVLLIDCRQVMEARGEADIIKKLASQVGYRPVFSWANNISSMLDLAIQSTTGVKAGFSENLEAQIVKILQTTASALKNVSLSARTKDDRDATLTDDAYLEAHPERRAVVVIDNFLHKGDEKGIFYDRLSDWAAALVQSNIAHVIFLTTDTTYSKTLSRALPDRVFHQVRLSDLSPDVAKRFVISQLNNQSQPQPGADDSRIKLSNQQLRSDLAELDECISLLGGRVTDLQLLARRLKAGQSPSKAVSDIIEQSSIEILRFFLLSTKPTTPSGADKKWSAEQAWSLIKALATSPNEALPYNQVLLSPTFAYSTSPDAASPEAALEALANAELITIHSRHGRPATIKAGKPVYQAAFRKLLEDPVVKARMDLAMLTELVKIENKNIEKAEAELAVLGQAGAQNGSWGWGLAGERVKYLLGKVKASQWRIEKWEGEIKGLKKVLEKEV
ncbi:NONE-like protein [Thermochaetoides thermophila DSM 1495]|uniref:Mitochondrial escape protein 2 n=1 Tax=Chaetomium thermophilum (strain DSM 1495 / CBS 144.50 / IMI 039719) TaxID=759272 RepID=G0RYP8_CHATD|nr:NONE-like protein [Thermochaetoides thermophila DSM 1495]EGS24034.1 NONE-like protein [Thermochaetoides thermophila DSM 1495]